MGGVEFKQEWELEQELLWILADNDLCKDDLWVDLQALWEMTLSSTGHMEGNNWKMAWLMIYFAKNTAWGEKRFCFSITWWWWQRFYI